MDLEWWKLVFWGGPFLLVEFVLVYGAVHHILDPDIRNSLDAKRFNERLR
jgi:hypothetical protein